MASHSILPPVYAGTITGQIQTATGGAIAKGTLTFGLNQPAVMSGTASIVTQLASCYTDNFGNVVGLPDPIALPIASVTTSAGSLAAGTYYIKIAYYVSGTLSNVSPETTAILSAPGTVYVNAPVLQPAGATGYKVYIGTASGTETLQGTISGWSQFSQSSSLAAGAAMPGANGTSCSIAFTETHLFARLRESTLPMPISRTAPTIWLT